MVGREGRDGIGITIGGIENPMLGRPGRPGIDGIEKVTVGREGRDGIGITIGGIENPGNVHALILLL